MPAKLSIIILNWNGWEHTLRCLETLFRSHYSNFEVVLIDNGSSPESLLKVHDWLSGRLSVKTNLNAIHGPAQKPSVVFQYCANDLNAGSVVVSRPDRSIVLVRSEINLGFAGGCNLGIRYALSDNQVGILFLLNNDMEIEPDAINRLANFLLSSESAGVCQPKIMLSREKGLIDSVGINVTWFGRAEQVAYRQQDCGLYQGDPRVVYGASGGAMMLKREVLDSVGLFDEDFFAYYEDVDLALRIRKAKWGVYCVPDAVTYHFHSASLGAASPKKWYFPIRNSFLMVIKNLPWYSVIVFFLFYYPLFLAVALNATFAKRDAWGWILKGIADGVCMVPSAIAKRYSSNKYTKSDKYPLVGV